MPSVQLLLFRTYIFVDGSGTWPRLVVDPEDVVQGTMSKHWTYARNELMGDSRGITESEGWTIRKIS